ncbi:hypothetical protein RDABS01_003104, partial [Bienertia sinuspersici]
TTTKALPYFPSSKIQFRFTSLWNHPARRNQKNKDKGLGSIPDAFWFIFYLFFQQNLLSKLLFYVNNGDTSGPELPSWIFQLPFIKPITIYSIMSRLTSPTILRFSVITNHLDTFSDQRCFKLSYDQKIEEIQVTLGYFHVPSYIFQCKTLGNLEFKISQRRGRKPFNNISMQLASCPLLKVVDMRLDCVSNSPRIRIVSPNLKSLSFKIRNAIDQHQVIIDAPKLTYLYIIGGRSLIDFVMDPTELDTADINLTYFSYLACEREWMQMIFFREICKFVVQLPSVCELHLECNMKLFANMHSVNSMPLFGNLSYFTIILTRSSGIIDILLFL